MPILSDEYWMKIAIDLAKRGKYTTSPNPCVGCVIVKNEQIIGQGYHIKAGEGHAEVNAINSVVDNDLTDATVYVTLEPCSHYGRTPPCAEMLARTKIKRVVAAMQDPNPLVSGKGFSILRKAGIETECGVLEQESRDLNKGFLYRMSTGLPYVRLKLATSLDGKISLSNGKSKWITSSEARQDVQIYRASSSAILTTSNTVLADNPLMNVRFNELPDDIRSNYPLKEIRQPNLILLDSSFKVSSNSNIWNECNRKVFWVGNNNCEPQYQKEQSVIIKKKFPNFEIKNILKEIASYGINDIWVEGGAILAGELIKQNLVNELIVYQAPKLLGDKARSMVVLDDFIEIDQAPKFKIKESYQVGNDLKIILERL